MHENTQFHKRKISKIPQKYIILAGNNIYGSEVICINNYGKDS